MFNRKAWNRKRDKLYDKLNSWVLQVKMNNSTNKRYIVLKLKIVQILIIVFSFSQTYSQDYNILMGAWRVAYPNDCRTCPTSLSQLIINPIPLQGEQRLDSAYFQTSKYRNLEWYDKMTSLCEWINPYEVIIHGGRTYYGEEPALKKYTFNTAGRFTSFLLASRSPTDTAMFEEFRYDDLGRLIYKYNIDKTSIYGNEPKVWNFQYDDENNRTRIIYRHDIEPEGGNMIIDVKDYYHNTSGQVTRIDYFERLLDSLIHEYSFVYTLTPKGKTDTLFSIGFNESGESYLRGFSKYHYSTNELLDSIVTESMFNDSRSKTIYVYNEFKEICQVSKVIYYGDDFYRTSKKRYEWEKTDNETKIKSYRWRDSTWVWDWYERYVYDDWNRIVEEENWLVLDNEISHDQNSYRSGKHIYSYNELGLLSGFQRHMWPSSVEFLPDFKLEFYWSANNSSSHLSQKDQRISFYPNPADHFIHINSNGSQIHQAILEIYSIQGQLMKRVESVESDQVFDISYLSNGQYFIVLLESGRLVARQLLIIRHHN